MIEGLVAIKENLGQSLDLERESVTTVKRMDTGKMSASSSKRKRRRLLIPMILLVLQKLILKMKI